MSGPSAAKVDGAGNLVISDTGHQVIRKVDTSGIITTIAGFAGPFGPAPPFCPAQTGPAGDGCPATSVVLTAPKGFSLDGAGNLFFVDANNFAGARVFKVGTNGIITTVAGGGTSPATCTGSTNALGDGCIATNAILSLPNDVAVDAAGDLFIADSNNNVIRKVDTAGIITTVAGNGTNGLLSGDGGPATSATLASPEAVFVDASGNLFISDSSHGAIRVVNTSGIISTLKRGGFIPSGLFEDSSGNVFFADSSTDIQEVVKATGTVKAVAGNGTFGFSGDGGPATSAALDIPIGVSSDASGNLFIADRQNNRIREVTPAPAATPSPTSLTFSSQAVGSVSASQTVTVTNSGTSALSISLISITGTNAGDFQGQLQQACNAPLAPGASCSIFVTFAPTGSGTRTASLSITDNASNSPQSVSLTGTGTGAAPLVTLGTQLNFSSQAVGTSSAALTDTLTNNGNASLSITSIAVTGANAGDFSQTNNCGTSVAAGASCAINVTFKPTASGARSAAITITDNAGNSPQSVGLSGTGATSAPNATPSPSALSFASQGAGTTSAAQTFTPANNGNAALSITSIAVTGANNGDFSQTNNCGSSVAASANCSISVTFKPTAAGTRTASVTITDNAGNSPAERKPKWCWYRHQRCRAARNPHCRHGGDGANGQLLLSA